MAAPIAQFGNGHEVVVALSRPDEEALQAVSRFIAQFFPTKKGPKNDSETPPISEVLQDYLRSEPGCDSLFRVWEIRKVQYQGQGEHIPQEALANVLTACATDVDLVSKGEMIGRHILRHWLKSIYRGISAKQPSAIKASLKLMISVVSLSPVLAQETFEAFDFTLKPLQKLGLRKGPKGKVGSRAYFIKFICSFIRGGDVALVTRMLQLKALMMSIFSTEVTDDDAATVLLLLDTLLNNVVRAPLQRRVKLLVFNPTALSELSSLYAYRATKNKISDVDDVVRETAHELLVETCCDAKNGICFAPKLATSAEAHLVFQSTSNSVGVSSAPGNPFLLKFLQSLKVDDVTSNVKRGELVLKVLQTCPDILPAFLLEARLLQDSQLSMQWLFKSQLLGKVLMLPLPPVLAVGLLSSVTTVLDGVIPVEATSNAVAVGIQHKSPLVSFTMLKLLVLMLDKISSIIDAIRTQKLLWDHLRPQSEQLIKDLLEHAKRRAPGLEVLLALRHRVFQVSPESTGADTNQFLLLTCLLRYSKLFPSAMLAAKFDVSKALLPLPSMVLLQPNVQTAMMSLLKMHVHDFKWTGTTTIKGTETFSHLATLMQLFIVTRDHTVRAAVRDLLVTAMLTSGLFVSDLEPRSWIDALLSFPLALSFFVASVSKLVQDPFQVLARSCSVSNNPQSTSYQHALDPRTTSTSPLVVFALDMFEALHTSPTPIANTHVASVTEYLGCVFTNLIQQQHNPHALASVLCVRFRSDHPLTKVFHQYVSSWSTNTGALHTSVGDANTTPTPTSTSTSTSTSWFTRCFNISFT
eukprot:m.144583 g.144583  ORF g.144583 m.144583 type:complete len:808 (-) comp30384_c1_seq6:563-2986(-)